MAAAISDTALSTKKLLSSVQVILRTKPSGCPTDTTRLSGNLNRHLIVSRVDDDNSSRVINIDGESFTFDHVVWADESQEQVYKAAAHPLVEKTLQGYDATILAYGAAQTGKSYTMGTLVPMMNDRRTSGLIQRCLEHIFKQDKIRVSASVVEVFNDELYDLLNDGARLTVFEGVASGPRIEKISSLENGLQMVKKALQLGREDPTSGSQSHVLLTLRLKIKDGGNYLESKLNLIDLAGSKVKGRTEAESKNLVEKCCFEESLSALTRVLVKKTKFSKNVLNENINSTLITVLKDSLDAKCLISLVACVSLEDDDYEENLRTLLFAEIARTVKIEPQLGLTSGKTEDGSNYTSSKLASVSTPRSEQMEATAKSQRSKTAFRLSTKFNMKNCMVILNQSEVDCYRHNKDLHKCKENEKPKNADGIDKKNQNVSLTNNGAMSPQGTNSTVSISRLETPNPDDNIFTIANTGETWTLLDESFSVSSFEDNILEKNHIGNKETSEEVEFLLTCSFVCQCSADGSQLANESVEVLEPLTDKASEKISCTLADNVSLLSICSGEETAFPTSQGKGAEDSFRLVNVESNDLQLLENLEMFRGFEVNKRMKRPSESLIIDFSEPGPSGLAGCPTPNKIQKLDENNSSSKVTGVQGPCESDNSSSEDGKDYCDNTENVQKVLAEKQNAQNAYILRALNSCNVKQLQILPRVGAKTAMSIYQYRSIHGEFKSLKDLKNLPIWTPKFFDKFLTANNVILE